jgi:ribonuclease HI
MEKIPAAVINPMLKGKIPFQIRIVDNRETSKEEAESAGKEIQVYVDGLATNGKVGAAAVLIREGKTLQMLHLHLGTENEHTVHEAELVGILLGLQLINTEKKVSTSCLIGVDNQAVIQAFQSDLRSPGQHITREAIQIVNRIQKCKGKTKYSLTIRWTAGHKGIERNEMADKEAKRAADGKSSDKQLLPSYLRKPLRINPSAVKEPTMIN